MNLFGSDPEFFVVNKAGICIPPAVLRLKHDIETFGVSDPGDENNPNFNRHPVFYKSKDVTVIEDGAAFELNIKPSDDYIEISNSFEEGIRAVETIVEPLGYRVSTKPVVKFDNTILMLDGIIDPYLQYCVRFGCDKDYDAYNDMESDEVDASQIPYRYAGGHLHISGVPHELAKPFIRLLDIYVGNTCIAFSPHPDEDAHRQRYYGRPGKYRLPMYGDIEGIEYRTPSVSWITNISTTFRVLDMARKACAIIHDVNTTVGLFNNFTKRATENILACKPVEAFNLYTTLLGK